MRNIILGTILASIIAIPASAKVSIISTSAATTATYVVIINGNKVKAKDKEELFNRLCERMDGKVVTRITKERWLWKDKTFAGCYVGNNLVTPNGFGYDLDTLTEYDFLYTLDN